MKEDRLAEVQIAAEDYRLAQKRASQAREHFIDAIVVAREGKATHQEIAERCVTADGKHLSRQRVAQFVDERRKKADGS